MDAERACERSIVGTLERIRVGLPLHDPHRIVIPRRDTGGQPAARRAAVVVGERHEWRLGEPPTSVSRHRRPSRPLVPDDPQREVPTFECRVQERLGAVSRPVVYDDHLQTIPSQGLIAQRVEQCLDAVRPVARREDNRDDRCARHAAGG